MLAQGLPIPANRESARLVLAAIRERGAVPAITAVDRGVPVVGLEDEALERFLRREGVRKVSTRDLPAAMVARADGATTVAASIALAALAGIRVFATGGIGGVHRGLPGEGSWVGDESADLLEMTRAPVVVICAGAKSILDLPATAERLETLGVPVVGYRTSDLPGFFTRETGIKGVLIIGVQPTTKVAVPRARARAIIRFIELLQRKRGSRVDGARAQRHTAGCEPGEGGGLLDQQNDR